MKHWCKMDTKRCVKCDAEKYLSEFYRKRSSYTGKCKSCLCEEQRARSNTNKELLKEKKKVYRVINKESIAQYQAEYTKRTESKKNRIKSDKKYYETNKDKIRERRRKYDKIYRANNICARLEDSLRSRIRAALNGSCSVSLRELIGCSMDSLKCWIEYQFDSDMNWENYGIFWNLDHVRPCNLYKLDDISEIKECFSWENTRPLRKSDNLEKSDSYTNELATEHEHILSGYKNLKSTW